MVLSFERGRDIKDAVKIGRAEGAFRINNVYLKAVIFDEGGVGTPNLGRYFKNELEQEYLVKPSGAYVLISLAKKGEKGKLREFLGYFLKDIPYTATAHFTFIFEAEDGENHPRNTFVPQQGKYFWKDVMGLDLVIDNKIVDIPEGRIIPSSDFQFELAGEQYPARPKE